MAARRRYSRASALIRREVCFSLSSPCFFTFLLYNLYFSRFRPVSHASTHESSVTAVGTGKNETTTVFRHGAVASQLRQRGLLAPPRSIPHRLNASMRDGSVLTLLPD